MTHLSLLLEGVVVSTTPSDAFTSGIGTGMVALLFSGIFPLHRFASPDTYPNLEATTRYAYGITIAFLQKLIGLRVRRTF